MYVEYNYMVELANGFSKLSRTNTTSDVLVGQNENY